ncbi:hypothetical protein BGX27_006659 [Mortierella sp. AM989]|nr:hypothetical protein BGX27_006659 [Mortierella sp. AM989]
MTSRVATPPSSSDSTRGTRTRQQQQQQQQQQPLIQKHQPFPSSTSSFSIHNSTYSSGLLGPNDSTRISTFQAGTSAGSSSNSSISNFNFSGQYLHTQSSTSLEQRRTPRSYSLFDITTSSAHCIQPYGGTETQNGAASNGTVNNGTARASRGNLTRPLFLSPHQDQASDMNSLYTIDSSTPAVGASGDSDDESAAGDGVSYFGSTGQDYLLKQKRAYRSKIICWLDLMALILFTTLTVLRPSKPDEGGQAPGGGWTWEWNLIPWLLTFTTVVRILLMAFTARYSDGNYNTAVIFVCMVITLCIMFEVNTVIQHRIALTTTIIAQYVVSMILTQMHWINYSVHTPMSAAFAYTYDPILSEGITFSRESRYTGTHSHYRASTLRRGTSYGTMNSSPFNTVQELDEELDDDHDAFIKVNVDRRAPSTRQNFYIHDTGTEGEGEDDNANEDDSHANDDGDEAYQDEEQDMATLLAFQDARRQQVYAFSPTASSAIIPARSILSPQALPGDSNNNRTPLSWALQGQQSGSYASSYDMRMAAAGSPGAAVIAGGLTVGYTPRRRSQRSNMDLNGTGRRTWTGGHNIIYSGIFVEDSDEDGLDQYQGTGDDPTLLRDDSDNDDVNKKHNEEQMEFDDMIKAEIVDSVVDNPILNQQEVIVDEDQKVPDETTIADELDCQQTHLDGIVVDVDDVSMHKQHPYFKEPTVDEETENTAIDAPEGEHQFQEGPAAELEAAIGSGFKGGNIVQLDIKENSTSAVERTGDGINDFEEFSLPGTICDLPDPLLGISNGDDGIKVETQRPISNGEDRRHGGLHGKDHGSMELHLRERAEDTRLELETGRPMSSIDIAAGITHPGTSPVNGDRLNTAVAIDGEHNREEGGEHNKEEGGYRRIHIHERIERVTIEEGDEIIGGTNIQGATLRPGHTITSGTVVGGIVIVDDPTKVTTVIPTVPLPGQIPGQWVQIQDTDQSTGVITWGVADDIPPSIQGGVCLEPTLEPIVYIPPQRTAIVDIPQPHVITTTPQLGPAVAIEPRQIIIPPTQPVMLQPQPVIRQHPEPIVYSPPRRPVIIPPQFAPQPAPVFQPAPVVVARPPPPRAIIQPQPRAIIQPQPQIITPAAPAILAPQQPFIAPAPIIQPQYGTYETIVPGATGGIGGTHVGAGVGVMPLNRRYSVASIYGDDRSVVSVYDGDVRSVASIYDDRTVISINEFGNGAGVAPVGGVVERQAWMRGHPLPGIAYGQHNQLASAAHAPRAHDAYNRRQGQRPEGAMHIDMDVDRDFESDIYVRNRHVSAVGPGRISPPRYPPRYPPTPFDRQSEYSEPTFDNRYSSHTEDDMEVETTLKLAAAQHTATPSDSASTEISYQEIQLHMDIPAAANVPLQELAIETYFDTTKSQLKVREQQGQLLSEMALQLKRRQQQIQQNEQQQQMKQAQEHQMKEQKVQLLQNQAEEHQQAEELQQPQYLLSPPMSNQAMASPESPISSLSRSIQQQQQQLQSPPTLNFPKPPLSPPPVRLLANRGLSSPLKQAKRPPIVSQSPNQLHCAGHTKHDIHSVTFDDESQYETVILSTSAQNAENIMLQSRHRKKTSIETAATGMPIQQDDSLGLKARSLISESILKPGAGINNEALKSGNIERIGGAVIQQEAHGKPPLPGTATFKAKDGHTVAAAAATTRKPKRKQHIPPMSRNHLHPALLQEGVMACWNNEFGNALEIFKEHSMTYPRWSLASAEVHIVQQLIGGQLSEADSELMDALQHSEKVGSRILDRTKDFDASFMSYRSICSADTTLITANDNTLKQNYKWDCEMSYYDTLLYRSILQLTASSDAKGTFSFSDIKGGLRLGRAWKGYMRIKQEVEAAKERWQKLSALVAQSQSTIVQVDQDHKVRTTGEDDKRKERRLSKENRPSQLAKTTTMPISIPTVTNNASHSAGSKKGTPLSTSQPPEGGSRWSIFGKRSSWNHQSAASLSSSPVDGLADFQDAKERAAGSRFLASSPSSKGLANILREQTKAVEDIKTAVKVLEDVEDYLHYGIGLFYFIVSIVPKSMLPALRTMGLQSNHEQGLNNLEEVFKRKNGRAPFAALFLLISYLFLPRGMNDPSISLGRAGEIIEECLKTCPNGSSYLLMACHHARKTGNMIPSALNHITRGIQTCEAAGIPSINYRFELGLTFFIHQEFGKAADIFEILWKRFITTAPIGVSASGAGQGRRRKGRSSSIGHPSKNEAPVGSSPSPVSGSSYAQEEEEEDDFEMAPFCGLCLIASKVVLRLGQEGYFEYGREGFGHHNNNDNGPLSPISGLLFENNSESRPFFNMPGVSETSGFTTQFNYPRPGPDFDLLIAAQEVLVMMSDPELQAAATMKSASGGSIFEHSKSGSAQSIDTTGSISTTASQLLSSPPPTQTGKLNRFNKFAWNQCQKSLQRGRISPFLPLVILYLRRDLAYMKPVLLRKYRTTLETIWKTVQQTADADTQAIYLLLSAVVHRQLLPDDATFAYTALTDCLLLESSIESEKWVVPHCHYELGELLYKRLHLPQAALEQFQWIVKGPGKEARPTSIFYAPVSSNSNPRLSVFGGGFPSDTVTNIVESVAAQNAAAAGEGDSHSRYPSTASNQRLSQLFLSTSATGGASAILGSSPTHVPSSVTNPPNPITFYNSRYKKFEFSQALRQRSSVSIEQIQKEIDNGAGGSDSGCTPASRRASVSSTAPRDTDNSKPQSQGDNSRKRNSAQSIDLTDQNIAGSKSIKLSSEPPLSFESDGVPHEQLVVGDVVYTTSVQISQSTGTPNEVSTQAPFNQGWSSNTLPNILSDAQRKRGSQQYGLGKQQLRPPQSPSSTKHYPTTHS